MEDNTKFTFENDIYSKEFFNFIKQILQNVAQVDNPEYHELRTLGSNLGKKVAFDFLARLENNYEFKDLVQVMIQIFKQDKSLIAEFCSEIISHKNGDALLEILLDCPDSWARG